MPPGVLVLVLVVVGEDIDDIDTDADTDVTGADVVGASGGLRPVGAALSDAMLLLMLWLERFDRLERFERLERLECVLRLLRVER